MTRFTLIATLLPLICLIGAATTSAQSDPQLQAETNFEAVLHVILGSSDTAQSGALPSSLSSVSKQLRSNFTFPNYRLINTHLGRIGNTGSLENKSIANLYRLENEQETPSFLEWTLRGVRGMQGEGKQRAFLIDAFRFGSRVPVKGRNPPGIINYEAVGLTLDKIGVSANTPTLIGTLTMPNTAGTVFLVLTVSPVGN